MRRNLIMHLYPKREGQNWRRSVAHLLARWSLFNGRKIISVAIDTSTDSWQTVREAFGPDSGAEFIEIHNTALQEAQSLPGLLSEVEAYSKDEITFYCHAKGCTHTENRASHLWADAMFAACLDYPDLVDCVLSEKAACGAFRSTQQIGNSPSAWHFAGTFFWFKNWDLFRRNWRSHEDVFWGAESYLGRHFYFHESACLFYDNAQTAHLYHVSFWDSTILPAFRTWRGRLAACGATPLCSNPPVTPEILKAMV